MIIHTNDQLKNFYLKCQKDKIVGVDTEFHRVNTYYPKLCLIQLSNKNQEIIIDPLKTQVDKALLRKIIFSKNILKVFHAAHQDLEILFNIFNKIPPNVVDTQICMTLIGYPHSIGYANAVNDLLNIRIDKTHQFIDWRIRPLSNKKIQYAINDVKYLIPLYTKILGNLKKKDKLKTSHLKVLDKNLYLRDPQKAWEKLKLREISNLQLKLLKKICVERETFAKEKNIPIKRLLTDKSIKLISNTGISKIDSMKIIDNVKFNEFKKVLQKIISENI
ncbi:MAG: ribonuclease D [Alphaproteobacteria bacterium]